MGQRNPKEVCLVAWLWSGVPRLLRFRLAWLPRDLDARVVRTLLDVVVSRSSNGNLRGVRIAESLLENSTTDVPG